jgi:DNA-binding CsgD family transcriptional regulator
VWVTPRKKRSAKAYADAAQLITGTPDPDRGRAFAAEQAGSVDATTYIFARYDGVGRLTEVVTHEQDDDPDREAGGIVETERNLQSVQGLPLPRVAATIVSPLADNSSLTVLYGDDEGVSGILIVTRSAGSEPFGPMQRERLTASLEMGSQLLARLRVFDGEQTAKERASQRSIPAQYVLRPDLSIEYAFLPRESEHMEGAIAEMLPASGRLPAAIENAVLRITQRWSEDRAARVEDVAVPLPFLMMRVVPLNGADSYRVGLTVERYQARNSIGYAARRFGMSPRELQVLALVLQGYGTPEIAHALDIAESTAHDHIKRMLIKTRAKNRVEMAAKTLGWRAG